MKTPGGLVGLTTHEENGSTWTVEDEVLRGQGQSLPGQLPGMFHLTPRALSLKDFRLRLEAMVDEGTLARLFVRNVVRPINPRSRVWKAYAVSISGRHGPDMRLRSGTIANFVNGIGDPLLQASRQEHVTPGQWFTLDLIVRDSYLLVSIDGISVVDFKDRHNLYDDAGRISLMVDGVIRLRKIEVMPLGEVSSSAGDSEEAATPALAVNPSPKPAGHAAPGPTNRLAPGNAAPPSTRKKKGTPEPAEKADAAIPAPAPGDPPALVDEDFLKVPEGKLPEGWTANAGNMAVLASSRPRTSTRRIQGTHPPGGGAADGTGPRAALMLIDPARQDFVTLPDLKKELGDDFALDCTFLIDRTEAGIGIRLQGRSTETLIVEVFGEGTVRAQGRPAKTRAYRPGAVNRLRIERHGSDYSVALNEAPLGKIPINIGKIRFKLVQVNIGEMLPQRRPRGIGGMGRTTAPTRTTQAIEVHRIRITEPGAQESQRP